MHSVLVSDSKHRLPLAKPNPTLSGCSVPPGAVTESLEAFSSSASPLLPATGHWPFLQLY